MSPRWSATVPDRDLPGPTLDPAWLRGLVERDFAPTPGALDRAEICLAAAFRAARRAADRGSTVGPDTTVPTIGVPRFGSAGFGPAAVMSCVAYGPHPSPLHADRKTVAFPPGTGSVTVVVDTCRAATASAPPPGPAGGGWTTSTW